MTQPGPTALIVETTANEPCPIQFLGDTAGIVYFISFAHSHRYGANHPLARAAAILKRRLRLDLSPPLTFAHARPETKEEERALETTWQDAAPLAETARRVAHAVENAPDIRELTADFPDLPNRLRELANMAEWAAQRAPASA